MRSDDPARAFGLPRKTLNVLGYLILNRRRATTRDTVAFTVFPDDDEEAARASLRRNLSELLAALPEGRQLIDADSERIVWRSDAPVHVDVIAFEAAVREGRDAEAIAEYGGALLPTIYDDWATADRERLRDAYLDALGRTVAAQRSLRQYDPATATAHRLLHEDPWREDIVRQLMTIRYEAGDRAGALAAFERFATLMRSEMHTDPMPETFALRDALVRGALLPTSEPRRPAATVTAMEPAHVLPFVGRDAAMERAHRAWQSAAAGRASVLFVSGEAGVGKSRFTTELARIAEREGGFVVRGYTSAGGEQRPYEAIAEALHDEAGLFDEQPGPVLTDDRAARLRLFESVRRRLSDLARRRPVVVVLEDLHCAGAPTIELLDLIAHRLEGAPVLIVTTARSDELPRAHPLRALRRKLHGQSFALEIDLDRLTAAEATRAARAVLPDTVDEAAVERMLAWVDGVPLLLVEAVRDLAAGRTSDASSMAALVGERFERLSANAETALAFGAVVGERFDLETLVAAIGWRDAEVLDAIGEAIEYGFLRAALRTPGLSFAFTHDLVRVAATERIADGDLIRAHGLVARAIVAQFPDDGPRAGGVARHFAAAGEQQRAAEYFRNAARYALDVFANEDARTAASAGLALCDETDASRRLRYELVDLRELSLDRIGATDERRADARLLVALAECKDETAAALGRLFNAYISDAEGRREALLRLEPLAGASPLAERTYRSAMAKDAQLRGEFAQARASSLQAAELCERAGDIQAAMRARFIGAGCLRRLGSFAEAEAELERYRPAVDASEDVVVRFEFHLCASDVLAQTNRARAVAEGYRALEVALRIGDRNAEARARQNIAASASKLGRYDQAIEETERALDAYRDIGNVPAIRDVILNLVAFRSWCGDFARAQSMLDELQADSTPYMNFRYYSICGMVAKGLGSFIDAERYHLESRQRAEELGASFDCARAESELAFLKTEQEQLDEAARYLQSALDGFAPLGQPEIETEALALSARLKATAGDEHGAREQAEHVTARCAGKRPQAYSQIAWNLAVAFAKLGDDERAHALAGEAAAAAVDDALGMPADLAETYLRLPWHQATIAYLWGRSRDEEITLAADAGGAGRTRPRSPAARRP